MQRAPLIDRFGRVAKDLRISVTDRCNFRCTYCMPAEGLDWLPKQSLLSFEEIVQTVRVLVECGVDSIKLTGGEPLVRPDLAVLVRDLRSLEPGLDISLTTNGYLLAERAEELAGAGLDRVTVSCDSLSRHRFHEITLRDAFDRVMEGLTAAARNGLTPVKVNAVVVRGTNDDEVESFAALARNTGYDIRFIEPMPLDAQGLWSRDSVVPGHEILDRIATRFELRARELDGPATTYDFADGTPGSVGIIPSVSAPFCASCDRLRLTADGQLRACLFSLDETDLRTPLREGAGDDVLEELARACIASKWAGHRIGSVDFERPARSMSMIGG